MEFCIVSINYPTEKRQIHVFLDNLVKMFVDRGIVCNVIAPQSVYRYLFNKGERRELVSQRKTENGNKYTVYSPLYTVYPQKRCGSIHLADFSRKSFYRACLRVYRKYGFNADVIYSHFFQAGIPASLLGKKLGIPVFVANGESDTIGSMASISRKLVKNTLDNVTGIISVSTKCKEEVMQLCNQDPEIEKKIHVIPNGANPNRFYKKDRMECRRELGFPEEPFIVAFVGSFIERKGIEKVARAVSELGDIYAVFIGKGPVAPVCERTLFVGTVENSKLVTYLNACNAFVLPTLAEGCCNAIVEAVMCGLPVISSDRSFNRDILDESCSLLIDPENVEEIVSSIRKLNADREFCAALSKGSLEKAKSLSLNARTDRILEFIASQTQ